MNSSFYFFNFLIVICISFYTSAAVLSEIELDQLIVHVTQVILIAPSNKRSADLKHF